MTALTRVDEAASAADHQVTRPMSDPALPPGWPAMSIQQAHALLTQGSLLEIEEIDIRGVRTLVWKNLPPSLSAVIEARRAHGEKIFRVNEGERVSFEAFHRAVSALARQLLAQVVRKGDRVAVIMRTIDGFEP